MYSLTSLALLPLSALLLGQSPGVVDRPFSTFFLFATGAATGVTVALWFVPMQNIGRRFFILMTLLAVCLLSLATVSSALEMNYLHFTLGALLIVYNITVPPQVAVDISERRELREGGSKTRRWLARTAAVLLFAAAGAGTAAIVLDAIQYPVPLGIDGAQEIVLSATLLSSGLLTGAAIVAMVLGHWYLVLPKLTFRPLERMTSLLVATLLLRVLVAAVAAVLQGDRWQELTLNGWTAFFLNPGIFVGVRLLFGFLVPAVFVYMAWRCVRIKSNQSATGILYVILAFVLIGEIVAKYFLVAEGLLL